MDAARIVKTAFFFCTACLILTLSQGAHAADAPDAKYRQMLSTSEEMREADQSIKDTLAEARKILNTQDYNELLKIQDNWIKNEFMANVRAYMDSGLKEAEAWAMEIGSHADTLSRAVEVLQLRREGKGIEGVYEFNKSGGGHVHQGMMLVRRVDGSYTVDIDILSGKADAPNGCNYAGEGTLRGTTLNVSTEEDPEARLTITFEGSTARVKAAKAANESCGQGISLDGAYVK